MNRKMAFTRAYNGTAAVDLAAIGLGLIVNILRP